MRKALVVLLAIAAVSLPAAAPAMAASSTDAALALGAFAVFNQLVTGQTVFQHGFGPPVVRETVVVPQPPTVIYAPPPPPPPVVYVQPPIVVYPNGYTYAVPRYHYPRYPYPYYGRRHYDDDDD